MKLKTDIIALCDYALIANDGKISIMGIFDEVYVQKFPGGFIDKFLVATLRGEPNKSYDITLKLEKEGNETNLLQTTSNTVKIGPSGKHNWIIRLANVGFEEEGVYRFVIYHGAEEVRSVLLKAVHLKSQAEASKIVN